MSNEIATINIDKKMVEGLVERQMQAAIVRELNGTKDLLLERVVNDIIKTKVDSNGRVDERGYSDSQPLVAYLCKKKIAELAQESVAKFFQNEAPEIEKAVIKELTKQKSAFAKAAVSAMIGAVKSDYRYKFNIEITEPKNG